MDFGEILNIWENEKKITKPEKVNPMEQWLDAFPPDEKVLKKETPTKEEKRETRRRLLALMPQKTVDLHGLTSKEALEKVQHFLKGCRKENLRKVLIIHGKGNHSENGPVLKNKIHQFLEKSTFAGEYGIADRTLGGRGATWVILR